MILYGVCVGPSDNWTAVCRPSLPAGATVITRTGQRSIFEAYNSILDEAANFDGVEAVALIHDDLEVGSRFEDDVRRALTPGVGVAGTFGSSGARTIAWWVRSDDIRGYCKQPGRVRDYGGGVHDVDVVDGQAMVLSPDCARKVRFDARRFRGFHGYDSDFCREAKAGGFRVVVAPLDCVHHAKPLWAGTTMELTWRRADLAWRRKWRTVSRRRLAYLWLGYLHRRALALLGRSLPPPNA